MARRSGCVIVVVVVASVSIGACSGHSADRARASTPTTDRFCRNADLTSVAPTPVATRLNKTRLLRQFQVRLDPPPPNVTPPVTADQAWNGTHDALGQDLPLAGSAAGTYELVLALVSSNTAPMGLGNHPRQEGGTKNRLAWVAIGSHVPITALVPGSTVKPPAQYPPCFWANSFAATDAETGLPLYQMQAQGPVDGP